MSTDGVIFETLADGRTSLRGNTFKYKEQIKSVGGTWEPASKSWTMPANTDLSFIRPPPPPPAPKPREEWTKEEWNAYVQRYYLSSKRYRGNIERCCKNAVGFTQYDAQGPLCWRCERHGVTYNSYCGD